MATSGSGAHSETVRNPLKPHLRVRLFLLVYALHAILATPHDRSNMTPTLDTLADMARRFSSHALDPAELAEFTVALNAFLDEHLPQLCHDVLEDELDRVLCPSLLDALNKAIKPYAGDAESWVTRAALRRLASALPG